MSYTAVQYRCLTAVLAKLQAMSLDGILPTNIIIRKALLDRGLTLTVDGASTPAIVVAPGPNVPQLTGTNEKDDWSRGVAIGIFAADAQDPSDTDLSKYLLWEEQIGRAFINCKLADVAENYTVTVGPHPAFELLHWMSNTLAVAFVIKPICRESRG